MAKATVQPPFFPLQTNIPSNTNVILIKGFLLDQDRKTEN